ncbi:MAG TPA: hypothetical protein VFD74_05495, partial [Thermoleophilia bacterium]|nr:hypothetical protein [Thermoleophilia bacterium]
MISAPPTATYAPGLHLVLGPPNAGKLGLALRWWVGLREARPLLVVPSLADAADVESELLERAGVVFDDRPVCTIDRLVSLLVPEGPSLLGDLRRSLIIAEILARGLPGPLGALIGHPGTLGAVCGLIDEFGESGHTSDAAAAALRRASAAGGGDAMDDLAAVLRDYDTAAALRGRVDRHQALAAATSSCEGWVRPVGFHGFLSFTAAQRRLVLALAEVVPVLVTLTVSPDPGVAGYAAEEAAFLQEAALDRAAAGIVLRMPRQEFSFASPAIAHLERSFLAPDPGPLPAAEADLRIQERGRQHEGVRFLLSAGRRSEVESVAAEIVALLREGTKPDDIAVLVREIGPWQRTVREVFGRFGVPHRVDGLTSLGATGLGQAVLMALRGVASHDLDSLLAYLRTPYHPATLSAVDSTEVLLRKKAVVSGLRVTEEFDRLLPGALDLARAAVILRGEKAVGVSEPALGALSATMVATAARQRSLGSAALDEDARALAALIGALRETAQEAAEGGVSQLSAGSRAVDGAVEDGPVTDAAVVDAASGRLPVVGGPSETTVSGTPVPTRSFDLALSLLSSFPVPLGVGDEVGVVQVTSVRRA